MDLTRCVMDSARIKGSDENRFFVPATRWLVVVSKDPSARDATRRTHMRRWWTASVLALLAVSAGCFSRDLCRFNPDLAGYQPYLLEVDYPEVHEMNTPAPEVLASHEPPSVRNYQDLEPWPVTLEEAVALALQNSQVIRDVGGMIVSSPISRSTVFDPAIQETNAQAGVEAALSAFDAQLAATLHCNLTEKKYNNPMFAGGAVGPGGRPPALAENTSAFIAEISKVAPTGTRFAARNLTNYARDNRPLITPGGGGQQFGNLLSSTYETVFQLEARHPLLRGSGVEFNRIAGPNAMPGVYNGVLLARINTDISLADFEIAVRDLLRDVGDAYWELYFAYRNLDAKIEARQSLLEIWQKQRDRVVAGEGRKNDEALARQKYYSSQTRVENALSGTSATGKGVYTAERVLRRLMALPPTDGRLISPTTTPSLAEVRFDWNESLQHSLVRRAELRRQKWNVRRRELEFIASQNLRRPQLDFVAQYGWRGFGDELFGERSRPEGGAFRDLFIGDLQDWQLGLEFNMPIGNRIGRLAARHAELQMARERALLREQERHVAHELAEAFTELDRAYASARSTFNARVAAKEERDDIAERSGVTEGPFFLLDAQQRLTDGETAFYRSVIDYNQALLNLQYVRGTLLDQMQVSLTEGPWSQIAHQAAAKQSRRFRNSVIGQVYQDVPPVTARAHDQQPN